MFDEYGAIRSIILLWLAISRFSRGVPHGLVVLYCLDESLKISCVVRQRLLWLCSMLHLYVGYVWVCSYRRFASEDPCPALKSIPNIDVP